jgi:hypothetical protein
MWHTLELHVRRSFFKWPGPYLLHATADTTNFENGYPTTKQLIFDRDRINYSCVMCILQYPSMHSAEHLSRECAFSESRVQLWTVFRLAPTAAQKSEDTEVFFCEVVCEMHLAQLSWCVFAKCRTDQRFCYGVTVFKISGIYQQWCIITARLIWNKTFGSLHWLLQAWSSSTSHLFSVSFWKFLLWPTIILHSDLSAFLTTIMTVNYCYGYL